MTQHIVVVGNGMVGQRFVEELKERDLDNRFSVTVLAEECRPAYDRVRLSEYFAGTSVEALSLCDTAFYDQAGLTLRLGVAVTAVDRDSRELTLSDATTMSYDHLVLATGSYPFVPPVPGLDGDHCFVYRTIEDLDAIIASAENAATRGVVVGGGLLGLEAANALKNLGLETHVVEFAPTLMAVQLDPAGGAVLQSKIEALGVNVHTSRQTQAVVAGDAHRLKMQFADGDVLETDLIVVSAGIRARDELADSLALERGPRGGFVIDTHCQTSDPNVYAIGECASFSGQLFGLVAPGYDMAVALADHLTSETNGFTGADMSTKLKLLGVDVASIGDSLARTPGAEVLSMTESDNVYRRVVLSADRQHLLGAVLVGDTSNYDYLLQVSLGNAELPDSPEQLLLPDSAGDAASLLGDSAKVCSCYNIAKGDICNAVDAGACSLGDIKTATKASTGCGGCAQLVTSILNEALEQRGVTVDKSICPHFPYTHQELFHLIRVGEIKTFDELLKQHGTGRGCDICKPAASSIFASCWNDFVLSPDKAPLQDTNDYFLANMQKNGTYSIVPRVAAGEITPDKLIALGTVAKEYDLYAKITGGQRIDLFGATVDELPKIWEALIAAGFETGHAYGKSLRTVKSCVGSTWCRYGVLDSVGMAIRLENRYKGLRSPHKLKFAVSGCTRECAEAQSKDIGVIATEEGWNLYVCGNGGMRPRHADLFATGLDDETLVRYIDRVLMFYVRTADRLQRTSVWFESLEGGLDYLQQVVIDDHLNIAAQLESDMQHVVDTYECEWAKAVTDETTRKRFRSFVNTDTPDPAVRFVREREQRRPADDAIEEVMIPLEQVSR
ncbi:MAG: nitrite reductase large subunit NirB [Pseudomonadota bacterium]